MCENGGSKSARYSVWAAAERIENARESLGIRDSWAPSQQNTPKYQALPLGAGACLVEIDQPILTEIQFCF